MKLRNKILLILLLFLSIFIFNISDVKAANVSASTLNLERLSYDFTKTIAEGSDKSKMPADPSLFDYFFMVQSSKSTYHLFYSTAPLKFYVSYDSSYQVYSLHLVFYQPTSYFRVTYDYKKSTYTYGVLNTASNGSYSPLNRLDGESLTGYYCTYPVYECLGGTDTGFFLAKSEVIPLHTALTLVESQLFPVKVKGTIQMILPACLMILLVLLLIFIIRSKIWLLT